MVKGQVALVALSVPLVPPASEYTVVQVMLLMSLCKQTSAENLRIYGESNRLAFKDALALYRRHFTAIDLMSDANAFLCRGRIEESHGNTTSRDRLAGGGGRK